MSTLIYPLRCPPHEAEEEDKNLTGELLLPQVGGKSLSLMKCGYDFDVPEGMVLTVSFFEPWVEQIQKTAEWNSFIASSSSNDENNNNETTSSTKQHCDAIKKQCNSLKFTTSQLDALESCIRKIFSDQVNLVAVRSSSPEEDLAKMSFAGGYETTLGVPLHSHDTENDVHEPLLHAIRDSFTSLFDDRVVQYKRQHHMSLDNPRIAVILQRQIDSTVSGVAFSLNPINNCYDEAVISSNFGLGESVVAGVVTPDTFVVDRVNRTVLSRKISSDKAQGAIFLNAVEGGVRKESKHESSSPSSLTDEQLDRLADLVSRVEVKMGCPVDIEWAINDQDHLFLLQARPITTYIPLFPELQTAPGERKKLYADLIALSQGFSEPLSPLGLDVWKSMLQVAKPHVTRGQDGMVQELHGREYINLSNIMAFPGGTKLATNMLRGVGGDTIVRMMEGLDLSEYRAEAMTPKNKPVLWKVLFLFMKLVPDLFKGLWDPSKSMDGYLQACQRVFERFKVDGTEELSFPDQSCSFASECDKFLDCCKEIFPLMNGIIASLYSKWRLSRMFAGNSEALDLLVALNMDLDGNPTSEMGHEMLRLAAFPEIQQTSSGDEFLQKLADNACSDEFRQVHDNFLARFGCRGMKEIDIATPRSYENQGDLFRRIKMIDIEHNQILTVTKRKEEARRQLVNFAARCGKESTFKFHADVIQRTGGFREHPKYMYVFLVAYLRRRALKLATEWVKHGRLNETDDIFFLTMDQIDMGEQDPALNLKQLVAANRAPYEVCVHVKNWPPLIDSRGKIIFCVSSVPVEGGLSGDPISQGLVRGRAKVLFNPYEKPILPGDILVTRATEPSWTPIFLNAAGVVLELGGPLQHGAIIAREYGIPCISGVSEATSKIHDGDLLEVDGTNGILKFLSEDNL